MTEYVFFFRAIIFTFLLFLFTYHAHAPKFRVKDRVTGLHGGVLGPPCSCTCSSELSGTFS
nr:MAG TPA: Protein of unknown function (DUF1068) [Caudoviricetes sp.]